jgi:hypothetical protein
VLPPSEFTILPNTAGCYSAEEAVRTCRLARELLDGHALCKLEVLSDQRTLFPNVLETLKAAETLVADGFQVMVYTNDDPLIARRLAEMGCVAVMPLAAPIGSGLGIQNRYALLEIVEQATVPILVDAGRRHRLRRRHRDGARLRRRADEHRDRGRQGPGADGECDAQGRRGRARGLPRRAHPAAALRVRVPRLPTACWAESSPYSAPGSRKNPLADGDAGPAAAR